MKIYHFTIIILTSLIFSCEKKLDIDLPENEKKIVLNGIINPDSIIRVNVSKSQNVLVTDDNIQYLNNAVLKLFVNNAFVEDLIYSDSGFFESTVIPDLNKDYKISVDHSGLKSVVSETKLLNPVKINKIDTIISLEQYDGGDYLEQYYEIHYEITFEDNSHDRNFYFLALTSLVPYFEYDPDTGETIYAGNYLLNEWFDSNDLIFNDNNQDFMIDMKSGKVFDDELFNGKEYTVDLATTYSPFTHNGDVMQPSEVKTYIILMTVNEDLYKYIKSYNLNQTTINNPFAQPVQVFSNVENGLGLFSGYTKHVDSLIFNY